MTKRKSMMMRVIAVTLCLVMLMSTTASAANIYFNENNIGEYNNSLEVAKKIEAEGIVLLENDGGLPLAKETPVSVFGCGSVDPFLGGGGAGNIVAENPTGFYEALTKAGIEYNQDLYDYYKTWYAANKDDDEYKGDDGSAGQTLLNSLLVEMPFNELDQNVWESSVESTDTAIFMISRAGSEEADVSINTLKLRESEKEMLDKLDQNFDNVIVLFNICNVMEMDFLDDYDSIKAAAIIWAPGEVGMESVGKMLVGDVNPSGRLADTIAHNIADHPSSANFGDFSYADSSNKFVSYEEGIYVGYRYFETFGVNVRYSFGYGLSYTTFDWTVGKVKDLGNALSVDVTVKNTGTRAGKDVVQVYYTAPFTEGGIEKSAIELGGFTKTKELKSNESVTVTITIDKYAMSSYDTANERYVLDGGNYKIKTARSVQQIMNTQEIAIKGITYEKDPITGTKIKNQFTQASTSVNLTVLSRENGKKNETFPTAPANEKGDFTTPEALKDIDKLPAPIQGNPAIDMPKFGQQFPTGVITLQKLYKDAYLKTGSNSSAAFEDALYNSPLWSDFLSQFTLEEAMNLYLDCGYKTTALDRLGIPKTYDNDGPASVKGKIESIMELMNGIENVGPGYPVATAMACTWNNELAEEFGVRAGVDAAIIGTNVWYAPGTNTHRNPMGGRNFEYYSEDPILAGKMAAAVTRGAKSQGLVATPKHFALNDQESNRMGVCTWADEQSIREIYLKSFEIAVKEGGAKGIMSSFNRIGMEHAGASDALLNQVLRNEWGFQGFVVTDQYIWFGSGTYMNPVNIVYGGGDALLSGLMSIGMISKDSITGALLSRYEEDKIGLGNAIQSAVKNLCYMKMFTNVFDSLTPAKQALQEKVTEAKAIISNCYTTTSWNVLKSTIAKVEKTLKSENITQTELDKAYNELQAAIAGLKIVVNTPTNLKIASGGATAIKLSWKKVSEVSGYEVYRSTKKNSGYAKVKTIVSASKTSYINNSLKNGKNYYYKVRAYKTINGTTTYSSFSSVVTKKAALLKPSGVKAKAGKTAIKVSWKKVTGATKYSIYRAASAKGKYKKIATVSAKKASYTNKKLSEGKTYYYKVKAVQKVARKTYLSAFSMRKSAKAK